MKTFVIITLLLFSSALNAIEEKAIVIIIPSYNNEEWYKENIRSILHQNYSNYRIIYINDHSLDTTRKRVENLVRRESKYRSYYSVLFEHVDLEEIPETAARFQREVDKRPAFFTLVSNQSRCGALANQYRAISSCKDEEIVVLIDGDDWLPHDGVLQIINQTYSSGEVWMTHGSLIEHPTGIQAWCEPIPPHVVKNNSFRSFKCPSHLRTFYAWIFKKIQLEDLLYEKNFFSMTGDMAVMFPIAEMCGKRQKFIEEPTYIYNMLNPINDNKVDADLQNVLDLYIRGKTPYQRIGDY